MDDELLDKVRETVSRISRSLGKSEVELREISGGKVMVKYHEPPSSLGVCHPDKTQATEELAIEMIEEELKGIVPGFEQVVLIKD